jgi:phosphatidylglycerophosphate synthase
MIQYGDALLSPLFFLLCCANGMIKFLFLSSSKTDREDGEIAKEIRPTTGQGVLSESCQEI